jgi:hypothetical protein
MNCEIIQFSTARLSAKRVDEIGASTRAIVAGPIFVRGRGRPLPEPLTETCKNQRLRDARREVWHDAGAVTAYWRARLDWHSALEFAQGRGIADADRFPPADNESRQSLVDTWRAALVKQLLTPAWDVASVKWKQMALARGEHRYTDVKPERIERAIADDLAFLAAHPVRRSNSETMAHRREFKEAMRQRIRDIARAIFPTKRSSRS